MPYAAILTFRNFDHKKKRKKMHLPEDAWDYILSFGGSLALAHDPHSVAAQRVQRRWRSRVVMDPGLHVEHARRTWTVIERDARTIVISRVNGPWATHVKWVDRLTVRSLSKRSLPERRRCTEQA